MRSSGVSAGESGVLFMDMIAETRHSVYVSQTLGSYDLIHPHPALPTSCNERAPAPCDCGPVAMNLGRVATIMGQTVPASCNQCGPAGAMIAVPLSGLILSPGLAKSPGLARLVSASFKISSCR